MYKRYYRTYQNQPQPAEEPVKVELGHTKLEGDIHESPELAGHRHENERRHEHERRQERECEPEHRHEHERGFNNKNLFDRFLPNFNLGGMFNNFKMDDLILLALILIFLSESVEDEMVLMLLIFLFVTGL